MTEKLRFVALTGLSAAPLVASSAARDAVGHEGAVLVAHGHEVGHRAQRGEVGEVAP